MSELNGNFIKEPDCVRVSREVVAERFRQDAKWGEQNHDPFVWLAILGEEIGEINQAAVKSTFGGDKWPHYREEMVQAAAVLVAMIECFDRHAPGQMESFQDAVRADPEMTPEQKGRWLKP